MGHLEPVVKKIVHFETFQNELCFTTPGPRYQMRRKKLWDTVIKKNDWVPYEAYYELIAFPPKYKKWSHSVNIKFWQK